VTKIGSHAFEGCTRLTSINIPDSVKVIGPLAFRGCTGLTSVIIPNSVTKIGWNAFEGCAGCTGLTSIYIPDSVNVFGPGAFRGCTGLTSIIIPDSVKKIGIGAFRGCTDITSIIIPNSVTAIGSEAFKGCTGLTSVIIPDSVTRIESYAFSGCTNLTSIVFMSLDIDFVSRNERDYYSPICCFDGCTSLSSIVLPYYCDFDDHWLRRVFGRCNSIKHIFMPFNMPFQKSSFDHINYFKKQHYWAQNLIVPLDIDTMNSLRTKALSLDFDVEMLGELPIIKFKQEAVYNILIETKGDKWVSADGQAVTENIPSTASDVEFAKDVMKLSKHYPDKTIVIRRPTNNTDYQLGQIDQYVVCMD